MKGQELIDFIIDKFDGVMIDDYGWEHHKISGKDYDIRFDRSRLEWACDCKAFQFRHKFRKSIVNILRKYKVDYSTTKSAVVKWCQSGLMGWF